MSITGQRLRELREETGKSQGDVAKLIGISRPAYVSYETGRNSPSRKIKELSNLFNVSADYILGRTDVRGTNDSPAIAQPAPTYYHNPEVAEIADRLKNQPGLHMLFDASRNMTKEDITAVVGLIKQFKGGD
jgi:transcriptional regulator with XRE-family HTH domain